MTGGAEDPTLGVGPVEGTIGAGDMISVSISTYCGSSGCFGCSIVGCTGPAGAAGCAS